jgi:hypothetical protein
MPSPKKSGSRAAAGKKFKDITRVSEKAKANVKGGSISLTNARISLTNATVTGFTSTPRSSLS